MAIKDSKTSGKNEEQKVDVFTTRLLIVVKKLQQLHGLRHGDYQRYRSYCTRRIKRLRKSLRIPQGDKRHFKKRIITESHLSNEKVIHIPLMLAERAWSYAMQLRIEANTEPRKKFHVISRLRKAVANAMYLQKLCEDDRFDACTKLEAEAYVGWMCGTLYFELKLWTKAIDNLKCAQMIYEKLAITLGDADENINFYNQRIDELTPSIRYCAYNIGDDTAIEELLQLRAQAHGDLLKNIDIVMKQSNENASLSLNEMEWLGKPLVVKSEKVKVFLFSNRDLEKTFNQNTLSQNIELLEQHLMDCKDAISIIQDDINAEQSQKVTRAAIISQFQHLLSYLTYIKLSRTIQRNLFLADTAKRNLINPLDKYKHIKTVKDCEDQKSNPHYISRLYELSLQHIAEMEQIVGSADDKLKTYLQMQKSAFTSFRCYYIALQLVSLQNWNMAVAVFNEASRYANEALSLPNSNTNLIEQLQHLLPSINYAKYTVYALSALGDDDQNSSMDKEKTAILRVPLYDRLNTYYEDTSLITESPNVGSLSPNLKPIPYKPLFFDLVHDKLQIPVLKEKVQEKKATVSAGLTGFVKGIWGWGGSK